MRRDLDDLKLYVPPAKSMLNLANNENDYFDWKSILHEDMEIVLQETILNAYGTSSHDSLINAYSNYAGIDPTQVLVAPGSDSLIPLCMNALVCDKVLTFKDDFFRYHQAALIAKRKNIIVPFNDDYVTHMINLANQNEVELIILSNPNNPLGFVHSKEDLTRILDQTSCYVVVDEAYFEFAKFTIVDMINQYDKLIILRTLSKAWGLAGLRVGFAISNAKTIDLLKCVQGPFVLAQLNGIIASKALKQTELMQTYVDAIIQNRQEFSAFIKRYQDIQLHESYTNFVYITYDGVTEMVEHLKQDNIAVAKFGDNGIRFSIGTKDKMEQLMASIEKLMKEGRK